MQMEMIFDVLDLRRAVIRLVEVLACFKADGDRLLADIALEAGSGRRKAVSVDVAVVFRIRAREPDLT